MSSAYRVTVFTFDEKYTERLESVLKAFGILDPGFEGAHTGFTKDNKIYIFDQTSVSDTSSRFKTFLKDVFHPLWNWNWKSWFKPLEYIEERDVTHEEINTL